MEEWERREFIREEIGACNESHHHGWNSFPFSSFFKGKFKE